MLLGYVVLTLDKHLFWILSSNPANILKECWKNVLEKHLLNILKYQNNISF